MRTVMTDDLEGSGQWRDQVEFRLGRVEATVEEQARLRAAMDEDLGDVKAALGAHKNLLQSLHDTQQEHTARLEELRAGQQELRAGQQQLRADHEELRAGHEELRAGHEELREYVRVGFEDMRSRFDRVHVGIDAIQVLLTRNIEQENRES
jgi:chromosome segregation ATPase